jgi:DNA-binding transcriptional LysR family regulator
MPGEIPHLETFCKAAELLNFTAAAEALCLTQAAVSQRIQALEKDVGVLLFERQAGRVYLTAQGKVLHEYAQRILRLHQEAHAALGQSAPEITGELHLAASTIPAEHLLPAILQEFQNRYAKVHVLAQVADSGAVLKLLEGGMVSLALAGRPGPTSWSESKPFARDRLVLIVPASHRWAKKSHIRLEDLVKEPLIVRAPGSGSRACLEEGLQRLGKGLGDFRIGLELGSNEAIKEAVLRGTGVALLSAFAIREEIEAGRLHALNVAGLEVGRDLYVVTDRRRVLPPPARAFLEVLEGMPFANSTRG